MKEFNTKVLQLRVLQLSENHVWPVNRVPRPVDLVHSDSGNHSFGIPGFGFISILSSLNHRDTHSNVKIHS